MWRGRSLSPPAAGAACPHRQGAPRHVPRHPGAAGAPSAAATAWNNLHLAGDYVDTGLPATIEGAIRSGVAAARRHRPTPQLRVGAASDFRSGNIAPDNDPGLPTRAAMTSGITAKKNNTAVLGGEAHSAGSRRRDRALGRLAAVAAARRTGIGSSSLKPTRRSRPNTSCCSTISARSTRTLRAVEQRIARYLRDVQGEDGGWPLFHGGAFDISASVKAYFALKAAGDPVDAPHMARARAAILARGGARQSQRLHADHAGAVGRGAVARRAGHAGRDHAAARLVPVPPRQGVVLVAHRARAAAGADGAAADAPATRAASRSRELFVEPPESVRDWISPPTAVRRSAHAFALLDRLLRLAEPMFPADPRRRAIDRAVAFVDRAAQRRGRARRHLPGDGQRADDVRLPRLSAGPSELRRRPRPRCASCSCSTASASYCQPCVSPVWDTALAAHALMEVGDERR